MYLNDNDKKLLEEILKNLVGFRTVFEDSSDYPFGRENKKCLDYVLCKGEELGFKTKNLDDYCGYLEIGKGEELIGIICHLDVVPEGDGWLSEPFTLTKKDNKFYGRGVTDDKGPLAVAIIVLKIINSLELNLNKRIRLVIGCNEENGCRCMKYYNSKEPSFDYAFTPDATFPLIYGEKGILEFSLSTKTRNILDIKGGTAFNKIADRVVLKVLKNSYNEEILKDYLIKNNLEITISSHDKIDTITVIGKAGHASTPELGKNAISYLFMGLHKASFSDPFLVFFRKYLAVFTDGRGLGLDLKDEYSKLTLNIGMIEKQDDSIKMSIDIRFPVTFKSLTIIKKLKENFPKEEVNLNIKEVMEPLFFDPKEKIIVKLLEAYQEVSGDKKSKPLITGGGTYAKTLKNCVAFGPCFPDEDNNIHDANEFIEINRLYDLVEYYVVAILKLLES